MVESLLRDVRLALRSLSRSPLFTAAAMLTLALGIGGTTAMFTAVNAAFLQSLPYPDADRLVMVWQTLKENDHIPVSALTLSDWASGSHSFAHLAAYQTNKSNVATGTEPRRVPIARVTQDFFAVMGIPLREGRTFSAEEMVKGGPLSVVISAELRNQIFPGEPSVAGKKLEADGVTYTVIGAMPAGFSFPESSELWLALPSTGKTRSAHNYKVVARLKPGVSLPQTQADMANVAKQLAAAYPDPHGEYGARVVPLRQELLGRTGPVLLLLLGAVFFVLLIACVNVINLLFVRAVARQGETTVRLALGANRPALIRPFLIESVLLAFIGGALGLALALAGQRLISGLTLNPVLNARSFRLDTTVLLVTFLITLAVGLICGLAPAFRASRQDLRTTLAAGGRSVLGDAGRRGMNALVVTEVAIAFILLVGAGLLTQSVRRLEAVDPGFKAGNVDLLTISAEGPAGSKYHDAKWRARFFSELIGRVAALPGVHAAGVINQPPLSGNSFNGTLEVDQPAAASSAPPEAHYRLIGGNYFAAMGIPVLHGNAFSTQDRERTPWVAIVNDRLARKISPDGNVLGKRVRIPGMDDIQDWATIVGVVGDVHHLGLARDPVPEIYFPFEQRPERTWEMTLAVQAEGGAHLGPQIRQLVRTLDPGLPVEIKTMDDQLAADLAQPRFRAKLLNIFAAIALLLAATGIFGVVSYAVGRRNREISIRVALGSNRGAVLGLILKDGMIPVLLGIFIGTALALALTRILTSIVFQVRTTDPLTFLSVALVLAAVSLAANYIPAQRAARVDPVEVLRAE